MWGLGLKDIANAMLLLTEANDDLLYGLTH